MTAAFSINSFLFAFALQPSRGPGSEVFSLKSCTFTRIKAKGIQSLTFGLSTLRNSLII